MILYFQVVDYSVPIDQLYRTTKIYPYCVIRTTQP